MKKNLKSKLVFAYHFVLLISFPFPLELKNENSKIKLKARCLRVRTISRLEKHTQTINTTNLNLPHKYIYSSYVNLPLFPRSHTPINF